MSEIFDSIIKVCGGKLYEPPLEQHVHDLLVQTTDHRVMRLLSFGTDHQARMEKVLDEMAEVRFRKCKEYSESRYEEHDSTFNQLMLFSDVWRKMIRIRHQALSLPPGKKETLLSLREGYIDQANYAAMAVQMIDRELEELERKG